jgi:DNA-directed RNA polymerase beta' subunit
MIRVVRIINRIERLRRAIRTEGTPAIQEAWDQLEPHVSIFLNAEKPSGLAAKDVDDRGGSGHMG